MTVFDDLFKTSGFPMLIEQFGESILYVPLRGEKRPIKAIVDRNPPAPIGLDGSVVLPEITVSVFNSRYTGISSLEINTGGDRIEVSRRQGKQAVSLKIEVLADDSGGVCVIGLL